jgi:hypothetical protein
VAAKSQKRGDESLWKCGEFRQRQVSAGEALTVDSKILDALEFGA